MNLSPDQVWIVIHFPPTNRNRFYIQTNWLDAIASVELWREQLSAALPDVELTVVKHFTPGEGDINVPRAAVSNIQDILFEMSSTR
jgi:predicted transposase YdaD